MAFGADSAGLLFRVKADPSDAIRDLNRVQSEVKTTGMMAQSAGGGFTAMAGGVGAASIAVTAITSVLAIQVAVAAKAVTALYNLAVTASEAGSEIKDMQDKTGLAAVTLSTLKLAADNAGSSFEQVGGGIEKFAKLLGAAREGNEKAVAALGALGVGTTDLDEALKQVIKSIAEAKDGTDQITLAQKAFGKSGADLIPVIKQINGNLEEAEKEAKRLGTTLTESDIRAADEFGDTLGVLSTQVSTLANRFALQFAPQITAALVEVINFLARNQDVAIEWGRVVADVIRGVIGVFSYVKGAVGGFLSAIGIEFTNSAGQARAWANAILLAINPVLALLARIGAILGKNAPKEAQEGGGFVAPPSGVPSVTGGGGGGGGGASAKDTADQQRQKEVQAARDTMRDKLTIYKAIADEAVAIFDEQLSRNAISEFQYLKETRALKEREAKYEATLLAQFARNKNLNADERADAELQRDIAQREVRIEELKTQTLINKEFNKANNELFKKIEQQEEFVRLAKEELRILREQRKEKLDEYNKDRKSRREERDPFNTGGPKKGANGDLDWEVSGGGDFITGVVGAIGAANEQLPLMQRIGETLAATFGQMANAVGAAVRSFVLFGTAGTSFRKFAAEVIASIAQMSIVQAVFEMAQGFAMLALAWFTGNPKYKKSAVDHFISAAVFGSIGGVAAGVGRAVAGNSFGGADGGGSSGGGSGGDGSGQPERLNFTERFNGFIQRSNDQMANIMQRTNEVLGGVTEAVEGMTQKFGGISPGNLLIAGAQDTGAQEAIFGAVNDYLGSDLRASSDFKRNSGDYN